RDDRCHGVVGLHEFGPFGGCIGGCRELRASHTRPKTAGDGGASFVRRNAEAGGDIEEHRFHVAVGQCLCRDEASETKCRQIQSRVALTDWCIEELLFFRLQCRGSVATVWCSGLKRWSESWCWCRQSLEQPRRQGCD